MWADYSVFVNFIIRKFYYNCGLRALRSKFDFANNFQLLVRFQKNHVSKSYICIYMISFSNTNIIINL